jgi:hypothetical protein
MNTILAAFHLLKNKAVAILLALALYALYWLAVQSGKPVIFAEMLYTVMLILSVTVLAPLMRLLVFPEVSRYAETTNTDPLPIIGDGRVVRVEKLKGSQLEWDLASGSYPPRLIHYWITTLICYLTPLVCIATLTH